jgi:hypothetical protein
MAFIGFIQRLLYPSQGVAECLGLPWRNLSESGGGLRRNMHIFQLFINLNHLPRLWMHSPHDASL